MIAQEKSASPFYRYHQNKRQLIGGRKAEMTLAIKIRWQNANVVSSHDATEQVKCHRDVKD